MSTALTRSHGAPDLAILVADAERARGYANAEKAAATRKAYGADFLIFRTWCEERQLDALPASPAIVAAFLAHEASRNVKASTIGRRTAAIRYAHKLSSPLFEPPAVVASRLYVLWVDATGASGRSGMQVGLSAGQ